MTVMKEILADKSLKELEEIVKSFGQPIYRAKQLYAWVLLGVPYEGMTNLPVGFCAQLAEYYSDTAVQIEKTLRSEDGSEKYLYRLADGEMIEGVFLPNRYGNTLCVSTQVGCRMGCAFCASGLSGLTRNLSAGEILGQFIAVSAQQLINPDKTKNEDGMCVREKSTDGRAISNVVLMGSGEPFDNYENVVKFIRLISDPNGLKVSPRNLSLSTCGLVPPIRRLADEKFGVTLSLSLHATTDVIRQRLMPIAKKYSLQETISAVKYYFERTGRRVIFEYSLIKGINVSLDDAKRLAALSKGLSCHINLIQLNRVPELNLAGCSGKEAGDFLKTLTELGVSATLRRSYGSDIGGACGQLRNTYVKNGGTRS